jgi:hypothetical protein
MGSMQDDYRFKLISCKYDTVGCVFTKEYLYPEGLDGNRQEKVVNTYYFSDSKNDKNLNKIKMISKVSRFPYKEDQTESKYIFYGKFLPDQEYKLEEPDKETYKKFKIIFYKLVGKCKQ